MRSLLNNAEIEEILRSMHKDDLVKILDLEGLRTTGTKSALIEKIMNNINKQHLTKYLIDYLYLINQGTTASISKIKTLFNSTYRSLKQLDPPKIKIEKELELFIYGFLKGRYHNKYNVNAQTICKRKGRTMRPDIVINSSLAIELKVVKSANDIHNGVGQAVSYSTEYPFVILYLYNKNGVVYEPSNATPNNIKIINYIP